METGDPMGDYYSKTQRIVLLVDLNPLVSLPNPRSRDRFLSSLLGSARALTSFPQLSSSLFAFKLFLSSLSPLLSCSRIHSLVPNSPRSLSFDRPVPAFDSLSETLASIPWDGFQLPGCDPRASCVAASMRQVVLDYGWDAAIDDSEAGTLLNCCDSVAVRSNLVVMLSPICGSLRSLSEFLDVGIGDEWSGNPSALREKFRGVFANVNDAFVSRDIQFSWVDVRCEEMGKSESGFELLESGVKGLGWGFCSADSIVLGSALVPFGLIYPKIGVSQNGFGFDDCSRKLYVQLGLDILGVDQRPLECKCCDLELVDSKLYGQQSSDSDGIKEVTNSRKLVTDLKNKMWGFFGDGVNKIQVKALHKNTELSKFKGSLLEPLLVREVLSKSGKDQKESCDEFFADKVLAMISREWGDFVPRKSAPIWQILLSFLYREGYCALVSVLDPMGDSIIGILKPFTVSSALLFLTDDVPETLQPIKQSDRVVKKSRRNKKSKLLQDQTWDSFCAAAFENSELELEEVYFNRACNNTSKKMRFLKCWMKQITKSIFVDLASQEKSKSSQQEFKNDLDDRLIEEPMSCASVGEDSLTSASKLQDTPAMEIQSETSEAFFNTFSNKIQQGLECESVDLGAFAHRLVNSSIYWLSRKCGAQNSESQIPEQKSHDSTGGSLGAELVQLLLKDPKDFICKGRSNDTRAQTPEGSASSETMVKEYELQILFRMEILQSEVGHSIGESMKQKFVKQMCLLLETIQCHLETGFFGDWSLDDYVGKIIKSRYAETLKEVVQKIYKKMDLLLFEDDEDELPNHVLNSEDGNPSLKDKLVNDEPHKNLRTSELVSAEESLRSLENDSETKGITTQEDHAQKLTQARERREQARRFTSFTSWPDLHRVWAPKQQPMPTKPKSDHRGKMLKRKKRHTEEYDDSVCETPMTGNKRSNSRHTLRSSEDKDYSNQSSHSVSKSLFQDDDDD